MNDVAYIGSVVPAGTLRDLADQSIRRADSVGTATADLQDKVEITALAEFLSRLAELPEARARRIVAVRTEIENGTYETPEKIDLATERLLASI